MSPEPIVTKPLSAEHFVVTLKTFRTGENEWSGTVSICVDEIHSSTPTDEILFMATFSLLEAATGTNNKPVCAKIAYPADVLQTATARCQTYAMLARVAYPTI